jgi:hypothetical protein
MSNFEKIRKDLIAYCTQFIESQINHVQEVINSAKESAQNESKSSAGDKHETGKSLMQLEQENNAMLLNNMLTQKPVIKILENFKGSETIGLGSLIETNLGIYFIAIGIGLVKLSEASYFVISPSAPVGKLFAGKQKGDTVKFNGKEIKILNVG